VCKQAIAKRINKSNWEVRRAWDAYDPQEPRGKLEDRVALVLDRKNTRSDAYKRTIEYYQQRNRVAHGRSLATGVDVPSIITDAYQIISELSS
jgi:hypothetical protein